MLEPAVEGRGQKMDIGVNAHVVDFDQIKGPRRLPIIGNMHQLNPRRFHTILEDWCRKFGSPYRFSIAKKRPSRDFQ